MPEFTLNWDQDGERVWETGVDRGVVYPSGGTPEAWNGLIGVTLNPEGAEATPFYANNKKYANILSEEEMKFTITAYMYPDAFGVCNGEVSMAPGVTVGQQPRKTFGMTYRNLIGNDEVGKDFGYKIHLLYNALAAPSEDDNQSVNDSPELKEMSWECSTTKVDAPGFKPTAHICIDSRTVDADELAALEAMLYGSGDNQPHLPTPAELAEIFTTENAAG